jgi:hypothetical protein
MRQPCTQKGIRLGTLVTLRQKNKEMKRPQALFSRDADATASLWRKEHGSKAAWQQSSCATRDPIHARK